MFKKVSCAFQIIFILLCLGVCRCSEAASVNAAKISDVFFAQHHVLAPDDPLFGLVGDLEALIKVQVYSEQPVESPFVFAVLMLGEKRCDLRLRGPKYLPKEPEVEPVLRSHSYDDSFTAIIPGEWVKPGLKVAVELRDYDYSRLQLDNYDVSSPNETEGITIIDSKLYDELKVGAPTKLIMTMFDIHFFGKAKGADYPEGWIEELKTKLPVAELEVRRIRNVMFEELVMPPTGEHPALRCSSEKEYEKKRGVPFDGEQGAALQWNAALKLASGRHWLWRHYFSNICGVPAGGQARGFGGVGSIHRHGVLLHELGHTFGLPHWMRNKDYPYKRTMYGKDRGESSIPNAGPTWAFDLGKRAFIPPTVQENSVDGVAGEWKKDPMHGGGQGDQEKTYMYRHFSDYSMHRIRGFLERRVVYWNDVKGCYASWDSDTGEYSNAVESDGVRFPVERDVDVISVLVSASAVTPEANIIYDPIGPYKAGLISLFDASLSEDREKAQSLGYTESRCNVCLRVTQGGKTRTYLLYAKVDADDDPLSASSFATTALNLPAGDGEITKVDLLHTPGIFDKGLDPDPRILCSWQK